MKAFARKHWQSHKKMVHKSSRKSKRNGKQSNLAHSAYSLTLKMEAAHSSEILVNFLQTAQHHVPENSTLYSHSCENPKPHRQLNLSFFIVLKAIQLKFERNRHVGWPRTSEVLEDIKKRGKSYQEIKMERL
jgi:hypothetical protein